MRAYDFREIDPETAFRSLKVGLRIAEGIEGMVNTNGTGEFIHPHKGTPIRRPQFTGGALYYAMAHVGRSIRNEIETHGNLRSPNIEVFSAAAT